MKLELDVKLAAYQCHKVVRAAKIVEVALSNRRDQKAAIWLDGRPEMIPVPQAFIDKHNVKAGGYLVVYSDGYTSFSPADAFESGYTLLPDHLVE